MGAIVIKAKPQSRKLLRELAEKLGARVTEINEQQYEDLLLGELMDAEKTGRKVSRASIFKKFPSK